MAWAAVGVVLVVAEAGLAGPSAIRTLCYATGQSGSRLKWLPTRPETADSVTQTSAAEPLGGPANKASLAFGEEAFADPFGDVKAKSLPGAPAKPDSSSSQKSTVLPPLGDALPKLPTDQAAKDAGATPQPASPTPGPTVKEQLQEAVVALAEEPCPDPQKKHEPIRAKKILENVVPKDPPRQCPMHLGQQPVLPGGRPWTPTTFHWTASALCHKPVYFEDLQLERYGHTFGPWLQPVISGGHFFLSVPALPYAMGLYPPNECVYTLGYYRPGSCTPYMFDALPLSIRAILAEGGVWTGMAFLIP